MPAADRVPRARGRDAGITLLIAALLLAACTSAQPSSAVPDPTQAGSSASPAPTAALPTAEPTPEPTPVDSRVASGLAFVRYLGDLGQVFVVDPDGSERQVSGFGDFAAAGVVLPFWSPDRSMIAMRPRGVLSGNQPQLYIVNADGSDQRAMGQVGESIGWSPDSTRLLYMDSVLTTDTTGEPARIWLLDVASGEATVLGRGDFPQWLPDGEHFSYIPVRTGVVGDTAPFVVVPLAGGQSVQVAEAREVWWSPDGAGLLLVQEDGLYLAEPDGTNPRHLSPGYSPVWSPDGSHIAYAYDITNEAEPIFGVIDRDGNEVWSGQVGTGPVWSPDGTRIAVEVGVSDPHIEIVDAATGELLWRMDGTDPAW